MFNNEDSQKMSAIDAKTQAQYIAFSPFIFQASVALRELGILKCIDNAGKKGLLVADIAELCAVSNYGIQVLLDFSVSTGILQCQDKRYQLTKVGYFLQNDEMTKINFEFNQHFCYEGLSQLTEAISSGKPEGLKVFGDWDTLYPALTSLPEKTRDSWFDFDHYYSDNAFDEALQVVFKDKPKVLVDIGGNTGRWTTKCLSYDSDVQVVIMDLPQQLAVASENIEKAGFNDRFTAFPCNMLNPEQALYDGADVYWMSQFLDCFSAPEIVSILQRVANKMQPGHKLYIMETFIDRQKYEAASFSLNATSLYFTCFANGNSRMYDSAEMLPLIQQAGLTITQQIDDVGLGHTLIICEV